MTSRVEEMVSLILSIHKQVPSIGSPAVLLLGESLRILALRGELPSPQHLSANIQINWWLAISAAAPSWLSTRMEDSEVWFRTRKASRSLSTAFGPLSLGMVVRREFRIPCTLVPVPMGKVM